jgi:hypothetical protein
VLSTLLVVLLACGCSDDDTTQPPHEFAPPTNLVYSNGDQQVFLSWDATPDEGRDDFAQYNVYRHTSSLLGLASAEIEPYKIHSGAEVTHTDTNLDNETVYYYTVRAEKDNGDLTDPTNEIDTSPRAQGLVTLAEFSAAAPSGLDLSSGMAFGISSADPDNRPFVDIYLGTADEGDPPDQPLTLKSPNLIDAAPGVWVRQAGLKLITSWDEATTANSGWLEEITLGATEEEIEGKVIAVRTPIEGSDFRYGKIEVLSVQGDSGERQIDIRWAYQSVANYIRF